MKIKFNGNLENIDACTLADLITSKKVNRDNVVVEHNLNIIDKNKLAGVELKENDVIEVLSFIGGG
jgi:sulfur carrier protein